MKFLSLVLLSLALILETTLTTMPLVLICLLVLTVIYRQNFLFLFSFIFGIFLDLLLFKPIGLSSLFLIVFLFLILIYQRKFEIKTTGFIFIASLLGSFSYLVIFSTRNLLIAQTIASALIAILIFKLLQRLSFKDKSYE